MCSTARRLPGRQRASPTSTTATGTPLQARSNPASRRRGTASKRIELVGQRIDAVAEDRGFRFARRAVVGDAQKLDGPAAAVEEGALGELVAALARGVDGAGIDEIRVLLPQKN